MGEDQRRTVSGLRAPQVDPGGEVGAVGPDRLLMTPASVSKGFMAPEPNVLPGANSVGWIFAANSGNCG